MQSIICCCVITIIILLIEQEKDYIWQSMPDYIAMDCTTAIIKLLYITTFLPLGIKFEEQCRESESNLRLADLEDRKKGYSNLPSGWNTLQFYFDG